MEKQMNLFKNHPNSKPKSKRHKQHISEAMKKYWAKKRQGRIVEQWFRIEVVKGGGIITMQNGEKEVCNSNTFASIMTDKFINFLKTVKYEDAVIFIKAENMNDDEQ